MNNSSFIDLSQLRVGMFVHLDVGWMRHPFPVSSFRIASLDQIDTLRGLGLERVRYAPEKSAPPPEAEAEKQPEQEAQAETKTDIAAAPESAALANAFPVAWSSAPLEMPLKRRLAAQQRCLISSDQRFLSAVDQYRSLAQVARKDVARARTVSQALVSDCVDDLQSNGESVIRLLSEGVGEGNAMHPINVMVLCLLLGKAQGLTAPELQELGLAALLHDLGKLQLPAQVAQPSPSRAGGERIGYEDHVGASVALAQSMELSSTVLIAIAQHHEMADGSGFPLGLLGEDLSPAGRILALVNHYDGLCNPVNHADSLTPHEALSVLFSRLKKHFDPATLNAFIRMMGVYPPGSVVQLVNGLYALVVSVNSARPLRPKVIVHDPDVSQANAHLLDLESLPELGIRRSLKPSQLPRAALDYLSPRQRICYFFERAVELPRHEGSL
ncbi:HD-GYP domain-containing protein [Simplicispira psychrophila]|uniref:HD-GYP domain-containing protein n=1 Tax=Simplicispira psychrophila TaxID=80882 RepID=UPI000483D0B4|nr:HD-GYP domain-containing protein [Simplicispira psychrophila]